MKRPRWVNVYSCLFLLVFVFVTIPQLERSMSSASGLPNTWVAAKQWLNSAECARVHGVLLAGCPNGKLVPFAQISYADDPGHALFLGMYAMARDKQLEPKHVSRFNTIVNFLGIFLIAGLLFCLGARVSSLVVLGVGSLMANDLHAIAPHPAQFGAGCMAAILPMVILTSSTLRNRPWLFPAWVMAGLVALAIALLLRQSIGLMGILASAGAVLGSFWIGRKRASAIRDHAILLFAVVLVAFTPAALLNARDALYDIPPTGQIEQHGISHSLYIGLGVVDNAFGIEWSDAKGDEAVKRVDPNVGYVSKEYYRILGQEYLKLVKSDPIEVVRIYFAKLLIFLETKLGGGVWASSTVGFVGLVLFGFLAIIRNLVWRRFPHRYYPMDAVTAVACLFIAFHVLQAAVIHPSMQYALPIKFYYLLLVCACVEYWMRLRAPASRESGPEAA